MTVQEAGQLLVIIKGFIPSYQPSKPIAKSWQRVIGDKMTYAEAEDHMYAYFENSKFIPMPADIIQRHREAFDPDKLIPLDPPPFLDAEGRPL